MNELPKVRLSSDGKWAVCFAYTVDRRTHEILVVQWQEGVKRIVWPPSLVEASPIL